MPEGVPTNEQGNQKGEQSAVDVGGNLVFPKSAGKYEHIDLPIGEGTPSPDDADIYDRMVERPGFPNPAKQKGGEVDIEV